MIAKLCVLLSIVTGVAQSPPAATLDLPPHVIQVMPSTGSVHENLLRFSVRFDKAPSEGALHQLSLVRADGSLIEEPFLNEELWSPDERTLTVVLGPGRVKTGLVAHDTLGRPLTAGETVSLQFQGHQIARWAVVGPLIHPIQPSEWAIHVPKAHTTATLRIVFPEAVDGMDAAMIVVVLDGRRVSGTTTLSQDQTVWSLEPTKGWNTGHYQILVHPHLEDPYGNEVGSAFETPAAQATHSEREPVTLDFVIR